MGIKGIPANALRGLLGLFAAMGVAKPEEAEAAWRPWRPGQPFLDWQKALMDILKNQRFTQPFIRDDMLSPRLIDELGGLSGEELSGMVAIPAEKLAHIYSRRMFDQHWPAERVARAFGEGFGSPEGVISLQARKPPYALTALDHKKPFGAVIPLGVKNKNAVVSTVIRKPTGEINGMREQGRKLLEGRRDGAVKSEIAVSSPTADMAPPGMYPHPATLEKAATQQRLSDVSSSLGDTIGEPQEPVKLRGAFAVPAGTMAGPFAAPEEADAASRGKAAPGCGASVLRQLGIGTRNILEGAGQGVTFGLGDPGGALSDLIGLPKAESEAERRIASINRGAAEFLASGLGVGSMMGKSANPIVRGVGRKLADSPMADALTGGILKFFIPDNE